MVVDYLETELLPGAVPIFWWRTDDALIKEVYFKQLAVVTVYNSAHMLDKLRAQGFEVSRNGKSGKYKLTKRVGDSYIEIPDLDYFTRLLQRSLHSEESIIGMLQYVNDLVGNGKVGPNTRIDLDIRQELK